MFDAPRIIKRYGNPIVAAIQMMERDIKRVDCKYACLLDNNAMNDPATLDHIAKEFPPNLLPLEDVYLILVECIANAVCHGDAEALGLSVRQRANILLLSVYQRPALPSPVKAALSRGCTGWLPNYETDEVGGLGFPILLRLCHKITIANDLSRLRLWFRL